MFFAVYIGVKNILKELKTRPIIINSTQNIESELKEVIYSSSDVDKKLATNYLRLIKETEKQLSSEAAVNVAVSKEDAEYLKTKLKAQNIVLAPNGIDRWKVSQKDVDNIKKLNRRECIERLVIFVGSAHKPNFNGFVSLLGKAVGFLPYDTRIVVLGGVSDLIQSSLKPGVIEDACFTERVNLLGRVEENILSAYLELANCVILPITEGGGSNLKTAEALLSGKHIVATSHSFRGYDEYISLPQVHIADNPEVFKKEIIKSINTPPPNLSSSQKKLIDRVMWQHTLNKLIVKVSEL